MLERGYEECYAQSIQESMTVGELVDILSQYPETMKIVTTWESSIQSISPKCIYTSNDGKYLYIDADYCFYKEDFARDPNENEDE